MLYMKEEAMYDYEIYSEMGLSRSYYRVKVKALYRMAFALGKRFTKKCC
ncbi:Hypothetical protein ACI5QL_03008 [Bacillus velezensis]